jgi:hypothetical protein
VNSHWIIFRIRHAARSWHHFHCRNTHPGLAVTIELPGAGLAAEVSDPA